MNDMTPAPKGQKPWPKDKRYLVHVDGKITGPSGRVLKPRYHMHGYIRMSAISDGKLRDFYVHRIVCETFHGAPVGAENQVDHINGNRADNRMDNLRWVTKKENLAHRNLRSGESHPFAKLTDIEVREVRKADGSQSQIACKYGVSRETIRDIRLGRVRRNA